MNKLLSDLKSNLDKAELGYKIIELSAPAMTVPDVIKFAKEPINENEICKTLIVKAGTGFIAIFLRGENKVNFKALKSLFGPKVRFATAEEVKASANVDPGAVCPLILNVPLYIDESAIVLSNAHFGSGDHMFGLEMNPADILEITGAKIVNISKEQSNENC
ncbi:MAG: YbaK/EbsC family protein [Patescibacteria group bacterium]|jgi:prolyl-tRNA editing enzyme YbaK/EbsC (Cys-tRNA(Pro) deacylase)